MDILSDAKLLQLSVGESIKRHRLAKGYTYRDVCEKMGIESSGGISYISQIEKGKVNASYKALERIAKALEVPLMNFYIDSAENYKPASLSAEKKKYLTLLEKLPDDLKSLVLLFISKIGDQIFLSRDERQLINTYRNLDNQRKGIIKKLVYAGVGKGKKIDQEEINLLKKAS